MGLEATVEVFAVDLPIEPVADRRKWLRCSARAYRERQSASDDDGGRSAGCFAGEQPEIAILDREARLHRRITAGGNHDGPANFKVFDLDRLGAGLHRRRGKSHLDECRARHDRASLHHMIGKPGKDRRIEPVLPNRLGSGLTFAEKRMLFRASRRWDIGLAVREPVALALPRIGGQRHKSRLLGIELVEVDRDPGGIASPEGCPQRFAFWLTPPQGGERDAATANCPQAFAQIAIENRVRTDFEERIEAVLGERRDRRRELHRLADIVPPVGRAELVRRRDRRR